MTAPTETRAAAPRSVRIDPRFRARRAAVQRELGRRRLRVLLAVSAVPALAGALYLLTDSALLDVDHLDVTGARQTAVERVVEVAGIERGESLVWLDAGAVVRRVEELPWVDTARVVRRWPGTVRIDVEEYEAVAYVRRSASEVALVAADGRVLGNAASPPEGLLEIAGVRRPPPVGATLAPADVAGLAARLPEGLAARLSSVDLGGGVTLRLVDGPEIRLGGLDDLDAKGAAAVAVLEHLGEETAAYVDVQVPSAPVVGTVEGGTMPGLDAPLDLERVAPPATGAGGTGTEPEQEEAP